MIAEIAPQTDEIVQDCGCTSFQGEWFSDRCPSGHEHTGVDLGSTRGGWAIYRSPVLAARAGTVIVIGMQYLGEQAVGIQGDDGLFYGYGHLDVAVAQVGQHVEAGEKIGLLGSRGNSQAPHLHFFVRTDGCFDGPPFENVLDPIPYLTLPAAAPKPTPKEIDMTGTYFFLEPAGATQKDVLHNGSVIEVPLDVLSIPVAPDAQYNLASYSGSEVDVYGSEVDGTPASSRHTVEPGNQPDKVAPKQAFGSVADLGITEFGGVVTFINRKAGRVCIWIH